MSEDKNLQPVLNSIEELKKDNENIIKYLKLSEGFNKNNEKVLNVLSDKSDVYDLNNSLSDNISELNKTLKGLPKSLKVEGEGKSFELNQIIPILGGVLALSMLGTFNNKEEGREDLPNLSETDDFNERLKTLLKNQIQSKGTSEYGNKIILGTGSKFATNKLKKYKIEERASENTIKNIREKLVFDTDFLNIDKPKNNSFTKEIDEYNEIITNYKTSSNVLGEIENFNNRAAIEEIEKESQVILDETEQTLIKRIGKTASRSLLFIDKAFRLYWIKKRLQEEDYRGASLETAAAITSVIRDAGYVAAPTGVGAVVGWAGDAATFGIDSYLMGSDLISAFNYRPPNKISVNEEFASSFTLNNVYKSGTANHCINFFLRNGFKPEAACGIAGNAWVESQFKSQWDRTKSHFGVFQWDKDRRNTFRRIFNKDITQSSIEEQYSYAVWELRNYINGGYSNGKYTINRYDSPEECANWWENNFERSNGQLLNSRILAARRFYDEYQKTSNLKKPDNKINKSTSKVSSQNSQRLQIAGNKEQEITNNKLRSVLQRGKKISKNDSENTSQNVVSVNSPTNNSMNYIGEPTPDNQEQSCYNLQALTGTLKAFKRSYEV